MASYFNLVLDTTAPSGVALTINNGGINTANPVVALAIACADADLTGYTMKVWGISGAVTEADATWETYNASKSVTLTDGDGQKTIYVKVRDDVYNESTAATASITLDTSIPEITIVSQDVQKISKISPKDTANIVWYCDSKIVEWKVKVVESINAQESDGTLIASTNGSTNVSGNTPTNAETNITTTIKGADLEVASAGDGEKILKIFVQNEVGTWSK